MHPTAVTCPWCPESFPDDLAFLAHYQLLHRDPEGGDQPAPQPERKDGCRPATERPSAAYGGGDQPADQCEQSVPCVSIPDADTDCVSFIPDLETAVCSDFQNSRRSCLQKQFANVTTASNKIELMITSVPPTGTIQRVEDAPVLPPLCDVEKVLAAGRQYLAQRTHLC